MNINISRQKSPSSSSSKESYKWMIFAIRLSLRTKRRSSQLGMEEKPMKWLNLQEETYPLRSVRRSGARSHHEVGSKPHTKLDFISQIMRNQMEILSSRVTDTYWTESKFRGTWVAQSQLSVWATQAPLCG